MAKQSGLHQLKGKVDGYSYYRQSGVKAGLMRRINEGMSARVKSSEEFANTRLNNSEFGNAADIAKVAASLIVPKFRPMFLNFSQAKLTKSVLALIKQSTGDWGQRGLLTDDIDALCAAVSALAKNPFENYSAGVVSEGGATSDSTKATISFTSDDINILQSIGADGVAAKISFISLNAGVYDGVAKRYEKSTAEVIATNVVSGNLAQLESGLSYEGPGTADAPSETAQFLVTLVVLMPYRLVNSKEYTLQEKCTFKMIPTINAD